MCNSPVPTLSENWMPAIEASKDILSKNKETKYLNKKKNVDTSVIHNDFLKPASIWRSI